MSLATLFLLVSAGSGCGGGNSAKEAWSSEYSCDKEQPTGFPLAEEGINVGQTVPDIALEDMEGRPVCVRDFTGSVVLINIIAGWCTWCEEETPAIQEVWEEQRDDGFVVLMYAGQDYNGGSPDPKFLDDWKDEFGITFPIIPDPQWESYETWSLEVDTGYLYLPTSLILDRDNIVRYNESNAMSKYQLKNRIDDWMDAEPGLAYE